MKQQSATTLRLQTLQGRRTVGGEATGLPEADRKAGTTLDFSPVLRSEARGRPSGCLDVGCEGNWCDWVTG